MLSQKCKYAIRAVSYVAAVDGKEKYVGGGQVAEFLKTPHAFTVKILQELVRSNIISSAKGPGGGFFLTQANRNGSILNIVEAIDGLHFFHNCGLGLSSCSEENPCPIHNVFKGMRNEVFAFLNTHTIGMLSEDLKLKKFKIAL